MGGRKESRADVIIIIIHIARAIYSYDRRGDVGAVVRINSGET
jgi:hypothetical protein